MVCIWAVQDGEYIVYGCIAKKLASKGVLSFAVHPGGIMETNLSNDVEKEEWGPVWQIFVGRGERAGYYHNLLSIIDGI